MTFSKGAKGAMERWNGRRNANEQTAPKGGEKAQTKGPCYKCNKMGHFARHCGQPIQPNKEANKITTEDGSENYGVQGAFYVSSAMHAMSRKQTGVWIVDTAASDHFCGIREWFEDYIETPSNTALGATETMSAKVHGKGNVRMKIKTETGVNVVTLRNVLHTPQMRHNLVSGSRIDAAGYKAMVGDNKYKVFTPKGEPFFEAKLRDKFYTIDATIISKPNPHAMATEGRNTGERQEARELERDNTISMRQIKAIEDDGSMDRGKKTTAIRSSEATTDA